MAAPQPVVLCILDGWGLSDTEHGNAPAQADTPNFDRIWTTQPHATLVTYGPDAGLPTGQMGNSEVGHTNIGAGRVVAMDLGQIDLAIEDNSFQDQPAFAGFADHMAQSGGTAHLMGLASPGGVHAHQAHIAHAAQCLAARGIPVQIHAITDGRDVAPKSAEGQLTEFTQALPDGAWIGSVIGRYFAMDRDNRWERVQRAFDLVTTGSATRTADTAPEAATAAYAAGETDEFIQPTRLSGYQQPQDGDGLLFLNFRADRAREILAALADPEFDAFDASARPAWGMVTGMVEYSDRHATYAPAIFPPRDIVNTLGAWVAQHGKRQFRLAETEKYPHVTFFLNGGKEDPEAGEDRHMPPSPKVATYDLQPEMSAPAVAERLVKAIQDRYDLIVVNFANPDMVGHTGDLEAAKAACVAVDQGLGCALQALAEVGGAMIVTADHGNCEVMIAADGGPHTAHTLNPVPAVLVGGPEGAALRNGRLADLAPTVLQLMDLPQPPEMTGQSLIS